MQVELKAGRPEEIDTDALILISFEGGAEAHGEIAGGWLKEIHASGEFSGKALEIALLHRPAGLKAKRLLVIGGGKREQFTPAEARNASAAAVRRLKGKAVRSVAIALGDQSGEEFVSAAVEGAILGNFEPDRHKTDPKKHENPVKNFAMVVSQDSSGLRRGLERGRTLAEAQNFARELANEPPNRLTPLVLADHARKMAEENGLECEVLDQDRMRQLGMGALLGVAQGSAEPPALIVLRYKPSRAATSGDHLALIGKGVTFDTGGISIKPSEGMEKMKYDMAGGAAMIGAMRAIAQLKPAIPVTALIPAVENMPGSKAQRPGDIVTTLAGKTVEVLNTDAEGRLILIDAIAYALRLGCTHLIDAATLTGSIVVALGNINMGAFSNNEAFQTKLLNAAKAEGEKTWPMPMDEEYREMLKSPFADIPNISGGRAAGSITAAMFLREFVDGKPWVHLDIAGTAWLDDSKPYMAKGPTGVGVRTFVRLAETW